MKLEDLEAVVNLSLILKKQIDDLTNENADLKRQGAAVLAQLDELRKETRDAKVKA